MAEESKIEKYLVKQIRKLKGETRKLRFLDRRGAPDRLVWFPHWGLSLLELKAPGKPLEEHQKREHKRLRRMGFRVEKIDSMEDVDDFLGINQF